VAAGIDEIPSNDFSLYDHFLDTAVALGVVTPGLDAYFSAARGTAAQVPLEMTKWFDTNYHHLVPVVGPDTRFGANASKAVDEFLEAAAIGIKTRPVLVGPITFLRLCAGDDRAAALPAVVAAYAELLGALAGVGAPWVQLDEPVLVTDLDDGERRAFAAAYGALAAAGPRLLLATYFGALGDNLDLAAALPVDGLHIDVVRGDAADVAALSARFAPTERVLSAGVIDGRNVWRADLASAYDALRPAHDALGDRLWVAPSCSLLHVPFDLDAEPDLDPELRTRLAFARQKLDEVVALTRALNTGSQPKRDGVRALRRPSDDKALDDLVGRAVPAAERAARQRDALGLPLLPTTTIGSFPQTGAIRDARRRLAGGEIGQQQYEEFCRAEIGAVIAEQEALGLEVLVHGEPERNDMVQYFGERLAGFVTTANGWVQSYGTRCVRPPILFGDVSRPAPMTVAWSEYAQSLTAKPVKGMLTGPVTILQWSFVRDDVARPDVCRQIARAVRDEVVDLERAGIGIIQVDEPALREGLPLRRRDRDAYLAWATECFRLATSAVRDATQIHTHMCYAEFGDILDAVAALDADVISMEAARSGMALLSALATRGHDVAGAVGPGVYDIHSPRVPATDDIVDLIEAAVAVVPIDQLWVNPDCGLKTRTWDDARAALAHMVAAARRARVRTAR
jgi:5-methyltetrahydropteroyltriglutamate--homocysteine methyltransferase